MNPQSKMPEYAPVVLRFGLVFLFLWFGISQVTNPEAWVAWVPAWAGSIFGLGVVKIVLFNGWFEIIGGTLLALGFQTRLVALLLSLHVFLVAYEVGYNDIGIRDFVLAVSTLAMALFGSTKFSLDNKVKNM
ncbi:MAG: DoxX family protein [bacterium]|nr:DoxX family protein [bacterium]